MSVNPDPKKQRCEGITSATHAAGAEAGAKVKQDTRATVVYDC